MGIKRAREIITCARFTYSNQVSKAWPVSVRSQSPDGPTKMAGVAHSKSEARGALGVGLY